ncbi:MAG: hypothetical protein H6923_08120 [Alphaproteobacteria bacterium]|nr:hypothetical protein [Alphaproteobacteria bacterium]
MSSSEATARVEEMLTLTERLMGILARESEALRARRPRDLEETAEEKTELSTLYARRMDAVAKDRALIAGADKGLLARLKSLTTAFRAALDEHGALLERARWLSEGLIHAIGEEVGARRRTVTGYGRNAAVRTYGAVGAASLALNRTV